MIEVSKTGDLDKGIVFFDLKGFPANAEKWTSQTGITLTKYYKQVVSDGVIIASFIPKKEEDIDESKQD